MTFAPFQMRDAQFHIMPHSYTEDQSIVSYGGTQYIAYIGYARPNIAISDAGWLITKYTIDVNKNVVRVRQAVTGLNQFVTHDHAWDTSIGVTITSISKASIAAVITDTNHAYTTGDRIEIIGSDASEANGDGYGNLLFKIKVTGPKAYTLVDVETDLDVDSSTWVNAGTTGQSFKRSYANYLFV